jgi:hypothetical protein
MTSSRVDLSSVIAGWQQKLLQLDRRNNLLYFKLGRGSVRILEHSPDEIDERLLSAKRGLSFPHGERVQIREDVSGKDEPAKRTDSETVAEDPSPDVELPESDSSGASSLEAALAAAGTPLATEPKSEDPTSGDGQAPQQNQPEVVAVGDLVRRRRGRPRNASRYTSSKGISRRPTMSSRLKSD